MSRQNPMPALAIPVIAGAVGKFADAGKLPPEAYARAPKADREKDTRDNAGARVVGGHSYRELSDFLGAKSKRPVGNNTWAVRRNPKAIAIRLHKTDIVTFFEDGAIILNSGGYRTVTTKARMNSYIRPHGWGVAQEKHEWHLYNWKRGTTSAYFDGVTIMVGRSSPVGARAPKAATPRPSARPGPVTVPGVRAVTSAPGRYRGRQMEMFNPSVAPHWTALGPQRWVSGTTRDGKSIYVYRFDDGGYSIQIAGVQGYVTAKNKAEANRAIRHYRERWFGAEHDPGVPRENPSVSLSAAVHAKIGKLARDIGDGKIAMRDALELAQTYAKGAPLSSLRDLLSSYMTWPHEPVKYARENPSLMLVTGNPGPTRAAIEKAWCKFHQRDAFTGTVRDVGNIRGAPSMVFALGRFHAIDVGGGDCTLSGGGVWFCADGDGRVWIISEKHPLDMRPIAGKGVKSLVYDPMRSSGKEPSYYKHEFKSPRPTISPVGSTKGCRAAILEGGRYMVSDWLYD